MSATEQSLLRDVIESPDDDAPRLVYADWLEERGNPRGEFIRIQCELADIDPYNPRRTDLESRELQLIRQRSKGWAKSVRSFAKRWHFRRGFVEVVDVSASHFLERSSDFFDWNPIRGLRLTDVGAQFHELSLCPLLSQIESVELPRCLPRLPDPRWERLHAGNLSFLTAFLASPHLKSLQSLALPSNFLGDVGVQEIAALPTLANLKALDLRRNTLTQAGINYLIASPFARNLKHLYLSDCFNNRPLYDDNAGPLPRALSPILAHLTSLDLTRCCITLGGIAELTSESQPNELRHLTLNGNQFYDMDWIEDPPSFEVVLESPLFKSLVSLDLSSCYVDGEERLRPLVGREDFGSVCCLSLNNTHIAPAGARVIAESSHVANLTHLSINGAVSSYEPEYKQICDEGLRALTESDKLPRLASVGLRRNGITPTGIRSLVESEMMKQLYWIDLRHNEIGDEGADFLAGHGSWPKLAYLNVRHNGLSKSAKEILRKRFGYRIVF